MGVRKIAANYTGMEGVVIHSVGHGYEPGSSGTIPEDTP